MESTTTFTHSHRHASQVAYDPRWTPHRAIGTTPYYLYPCSVYTSPRPLPTPAEGARRQGGPRPRRGPDISTQVRRDQPSPWVVRAVGRGASSLNSTILLWFVM